MSDEIGFKMKKTESFGTRLERLCKERGIPVSELARRIGVSPKSAHNWTAGSLPRNSVHLKKLCEFFSVSPNYLLWGEENKPITIDSLISKSEIHTGMYEITIKKVAPKSSDEGDKK